jgi:hypothetical protein
LATLIERSLKSCQLLAVSQTFDQCSVSCLHVSSRYVVVQMAGDGFTWTSNARTNLRTKKSLGQTLSLALPGPRTARLADRSACALRSRDMFSKDATLATTKLSKIVAARLRQAQAKPLIPVTIYRAPHIDRPIARPANGQRPTRQCIPPGIRMP